MTKHNDMAATGTDDLSLFLGHAPLNRRKRKEKLTSTNETVRKQFLLLFYLYE